MAYKGLTIVLGVAAAALMATGAAAKEKKGSRLLNAVIACEAMQDDAARLACYDTEVRRLKQAHAEKRLTLKEVSLEEEFEDIDSTITGAVTAGHSHWILVLADGSVWRTTEGMYGVPEKGDKIEIRKGAVSGFRASINGGRIVNVRRMR